MVASKLTEEQKQQIASWAAAGADLNEIQDRMRSEMDIAISFMDVRFLIADLNIVIGARLEPEPGPEEEKTADAETDDLAPEGSEIPEGEPSSVQLSVDQITIPGTMVSGKVVFSDGVTAQWYLDQNGRLGLSGVDRTYQPPPDDMAEFQAQLRQALRSMGY
jgi:hypothetical protein